MLSIKQIVEQNIIPEGFVVRYRFLDSLKRHPRVLKSALQESKDWDNLPDYLIEGSLIDSLLTETEEVTNERFKVLEAAVPTEKAKLFVDEVMRYYPEPTKEQVVEIARIIEFGAPNWKDDTLYSKYLEWQPYVTERQAIGNKIPVDIQTMVMARTLVEEAKTNEITGKFLTEENLIKKPLIKYRFTLEKTLVVNFESEIDSLFVDRINKTIRVLEVKSYSGSFPTNYYRFGYYTQASLYTAGLLNWITTQEEFKDFSVEPPLFIALNKDMTDIPRLYQMPENHMAIAAFGGQFNHYSKPVDGWMKLSLDMLWHVVNDLWDYRREVYENKCIEIL